MPICKNEYEFKEFFSLECSDVKKPTLAKVIHCKCSLLESGWDRPQHTDWRKHASAHESAMNRQQEYIMTSNKQIKTCNSIIPDSLYLDIVVPFLISSQTVTVQYVDMSSHSMLEHVQTQVILKLHLTDISESKIL